MLELALCTCEYESVIADFESISEVLLSPVSLDTPEIESLFRIAGIALSDDSPDFLHPHAISLLLRVLERFAIPESFLVDFLKRVAEILPGSYSVQFYISVVNCLSLILLSHSANLTLIVDCLDLGFFFDRLDDSEVSLSLRQALNNFFGCAIQSPVIPPDLALLAFNSGSIGPERLSIFLWLVTRHPEVLSSFELADLAAFLFEHISDNNMHPVLLVLGLIFQRSFVPVDISLLFEFFQNDDPRVVAAAYFAVAAFVEGGAEQAGMSLDAGILDRIELPDGFLGKRECGKCIAALMLNSSVTNLGEFMREEWINLLIDLNDAEDMAIVQNALCLIGEG
jgi:hypothetical protein